MALLLFLFFFLSIKLHNFEINPIKIFKTSPDNIVKIKNPANPKIKNQLFGVL